MRKRFLTMAAVLALAACGQQQPAAPPQPPPGPAPTDGGFNFDFGAPNTNPQPLSGPPSGPPSGQGGGEAVVGGALQGMPAEAQEGLSRYLDNYARQLAPNGVRINAVPDLYAALQPQTEHRWQFQLRAGQAYAVLGACDDDCNDVDLVVEGPDSRALGADVENDDYPIVGFTPQADGVYSVRIVLQTCTVAPCYVAARLVHLP
ncbi:MAG TPA: hypothetical protein PKY87_14025 [Terricaulis sp.]|nr:hypothetical protein [Terricaulis sp.]